jgi:hypothetical protein
MVPWKSDVGLLLVVHTYDQFPATSVVGCEGAAPQIGVVALAEPVNTVRNSPNANGSFFILVGLYQESLQLGSLPDATLTTLDGRNHQLNEDLSEICSRTADAYGGSGRALRALAEGLFVFVTSESIL